MGARTPVTVGFDRRAYDEGARVIQAVAADMGGREQAVAFFSQLHRTRSFAPFTTVDLANEILAFSGADFHERFDRWLYSASESTGPARPSERVAAPGGPHAAGPTGPRPVARARSRGAAVEHGENQCQDCGLRGHARAQESGVAPGERLEMNDRRAHAPVLILVLATVLLTGAGSALAADGALQVTVRDLFGVIPDATVRIDDGTGETQRALTDRTGVATFSAVASGTYTVRASFSGFADAEQNDVTVAAGETRDVELTLSLAQLMTSITVETPNRRDQLLLDVAAPTTLFDRAQIQDTGARSAKDLLAEQSGSGIVIEPGGGQGHLSLNGIPNSGVLVLVNGRRFLGKDANGNLNMEELQIPGVERIEVVKGAGSALYGSDALGGVVNFITTQPTERGATNLVTLSGGSYSDFRLDDTFAWRGERGGVSATGGYRTYDGYDLDEENPQTVGLPPATYWNASTSADFELSSKVIARFFGEFQDRDVKDYFFSGATQLPETVYDSRRQLTRYTLSPELDVLLSPRTSFNATYNYGKYKRDETRVFVEDGRVAPQDPWRETNQELKLTGRHGWSAFGREHPLQGGYEYRKEALSRGSLSVEDPERSVNVLWAQQELALASRLTFTAGVRYDSYSDFGSEWSPKAELVFRAAEEHRLRGSYGHGFRPPYFGELYLDLGPFFRGNPDLKPETSDGFTAGYVYSSSRAELSADLYYTKVKNGITFAMLPTGQFTYDNVRRYDSRGVNVHGLGQPARGIHPLGLLHLQQARGRRGRGARRLPEARRLPQAALGEPPARAARELPRPDQRGGAAGPGRDVHPLLRRLVRAGGEALRAPRRVRAQRLFPDRQSLRPEGRVPAGRGRQPDPGRLPVLAAAADLPGGRHRRHGLDALARTTRQIPSQRKAGEWCGPGRSARRSGPGLRSAPATPASAAGGQSGSTGRRSCPGSGPLARSRRRGRWPPRGCRSGRRGAS